MFKRNRNVIITFLTVLIPTLLQFIYIRYVSYEVDKAVYGNFILLQTFIAGLSYVFLQIPSQAYSRFFNENNNKAEFVNEFRTILIFINFLSFICIALYGSIFDKFSYWVLLLVFLYFIVSNNYIFNQNIFLLNIERSKYFYLKILESSAKFISPIIFYIIYGTLEGFIFGLLFGYLLSSGVMWFYLKKYPFRLVANKKNIWKYFKFAYPILFVSLFTWGISFSDRYFIEAFISTPEVAIYSILGQVAGVGQLVGQLFTMYVNPKVLKAYGENEQIALISLSKSLRFLLLTFILLIIFSLSLPKSFFAILIESSVLDNNNYYYTFIILIASIFMAVYQTAYSLYFSLLEKLNIMGYIYFVAFLVNLAGNFFISEFGIIAASISTFCAYFIINIMQVCYIKYAKKYLLIFK